jgi:hypothetical protein
VPPLRVGEASLVGQATMQAMAQRSTIDLHNTIQHPSWGNVQKSAEIGSYWVEVSRFNQQEDAEIWLEKAQDDDSFLGLRSVIVAEANGTEIVIRVGPVVDQSRADLVCDYAKKQNRSCRLIKHIASESTTDTRYKRNE